MFVTVDLQEDHIKNGKPHDPYACPIALAIHATKIWKRVRVAPDLFKGETIEGVKYFATLPPPANRFLLLFDAFRGKLGKHGKIRTDLQPMTFRLHCFRDELLDMESI